MSGSRPSPRAIAAGSRRPWPMKTDTVRAFFHAFVSRTSPDRYVLFETKLKPLVACFTVRSRPESTDGRWSMVDGRPSRVSRRTIFRRTETRGKGTGGVAVRSFRKTGRSTRIFSATGSDGFAGSSTPLAKAHR